MPKELRGIVVCNPDGSLRKRLLIREEKGDNYQWFTFPNSKPFNRGQIIKFLGQELGVPPGEIIWLPHIQVPKT